MLRINGYALYITTNDIASLLFGLLSAVMVELAQWLPILFIPEQDRITTMRCDVIHHHRSSNPALLGTHPAGGVKRQIEISCSFPAPVVSAP